MGGPSTMKMIKVLLRQLFLTPATNKFPAKYAPESASAFLDSVRQGATTLHPPVAMPPDFRGKIAYDRDKCTGCNLCIKVCPTKAIEPIPDEKKIKIFVSRCCFCAQCNDICPTNALSMTDEFLLSSYDKFADDLVVTG
ncbi:MAG: 4Fe-4S binding protein [Dehalococcoidia bacterium]|nr:4Fe-4S binding protein [Dehalococcoidia bacterium]